MARGDDEIEDDVNTDEIMDEILTGETEHGQGPDEGGADLNSAVDAEVGTVE